MSVLRPSVSTALAAKPPEVAEAAEAMSDERRFDMFKKIAAFGIILITLFAAIVEILHEHDSAQADAAAVEAQRQATNANADMANVSVRFAIAFENLALAERQQTAVASTNQALANPPPGGWSADQSAAMQNQQQSVSSQENLVQHAPDSIDPAYGPESDVTFPNGFLDSISAQVTREEATSEVLWNEHAAWVDRAVSYLAIITVLAVAVYLLGLALTISEANVRRIMGYVSLFLVLIAVGWTGATQLVPVPGVSRQAVDDYTAGKQVLNSAVTRAQYQQAYDDFTASIKLQPNFARAYVDRSQADFLLGAPEGDRSMFYQSFWIYSSNVPWVERSLDDLRQAEKYGLRSKLVHENIADNTFLLWAEGGPGDLQTALSEIDTAIQLDPHDGQLYYLKGVELLAAGRDSEARAQYRRGNIELSQFNTLVGNVTEQLAAQVGLSELEIVANKRNASGVLDSTIKELKQSIVGSVFPPRSSDLPASWTAEVKIEQPGSLYWQGEASGFDSERDNLVVEWYYRHSIGPCPAATSACGSWVSINAGDPRVETCDLLHLYFECLHVADTQVGHVAEMLKTGISSQCLGDGDYRVEVYVNGKLMARSAVVSIWKGWDSITAYRVPDMGLSFCGGVGWRSMSTAVPGMLRAFRSPDGNSGYLLARIEHPADTTTPTDSLVRTDLHRVVEQLAKSLLPSGLTLDSEGAAPVFDGMDAPYGADYTYTGGYVEVGAAFAAHTYSGFSSGQPFDRATIVGAVWGPTDLVGQHATEMIGSLTPTWHSALDGGSQPQLP